MSKELELIRTLIDGANEYEKKTGNTNPTVYLSKNNLLIIEKSLQRLESIDNANPSEALECLEKVYSRLPQWDLSRNVDQCNIIKQALLKAQEPKQYVDELKLVENKLKALEIIKEKRVNVGTFIHLTKVLKKDYEKCKGLNNTFGANICDSDFEFLTEEEFNLLKEVLE